MKRWYVAYGSNLNLRQMEFRCPTSKLHCTGVIENYELQFKGMPYGAYATIAEKAGASVPVAVWEIRLGDEQNLDRYEGYPSHYFKRDVIVKLDNGEELCAMTYIMNLKMEFGMPSAHYYDTVLRGYHDCGLDAAVLEKALKESADQLYFDPHKQQGLDLSNRECDIKETDTQVDEAPLFTLGDMQW